MKAVAVLLAVAGLCVCAFALDNAAYEDGVLVLNDDNFQVALKEYPVLFVKFYAEWCGHCKKLAPEWAKAAKAAEGTGVVFAQIDVPENRGTGSTYEIQGFPTLLLFVDGIKNEYEGPREANALIKFAKKYLEPAVHVANDKEEFDKLFEAHPLLVAGYFENEKSDDFALFERLAKSMRKDASFVNLKASGVSPSTIALFKKDMEPTAYSGAMELKDLQDFVHANSFPLIDELSGENYMAYYKSGLPLTFTFVDPSKTEETEKTKEIIKAVAKKMIGKVLVTYTDGVKFRGQVDRMGLPADKFPSLSVQSGEFHYNFPEDQEFNVDNLSAFFEKFVANELQPSIKSEPIPETQEGPVIKIVADSFESIVMDASKDVFVKFYAPWCGHCKQLAPIYSEMAEKLKQYPNIVIGEFDATANDIPTQGIQVQGFPTLMFFPADNKKGVSYEGDRSLKDMLDFVNTHTTFDIDMPSIPEMDSVKEEL